MRPYLAANTNKIIENKDVEIQVDVYMGKRSVACQTVAERKPRKRMRSSSPQFLFSSPAESTCNGSYLQDHNYSLGFYPNESPDQENTQPSTCRDDDDDTDLRDMQKLASHQPKSDKFKPDHDGYMSVSDDDSYKADSDGNYSADSDDTYSDSDDEDSDDSSLSDRKCIVFESQLDQLFRVCRECGEQCEVEKTGTVVLLR